MAEKRPTPRQQRFVEEYLVDLNGTQAAIRAGYSKRTANEQAAALLAKPSIRVMVDSGKAERAKRTGITADYVLTSLHEVSKRCMQRVPVMVREGRALVQKTEEDPETGEERGVWSFDSGGANRALELLGKHLKLFTEKTEHSGPNGGPIEFSDGLTDAERVARLAALFDGARARATGRDPVGAEAVGTAPGPADEGVGEQG